MHVINLIAFAAKNVHSIPKGLLVKKRFVLVVPYFLLYDILFHPLLLLYIFSFTNNIEYIFGRRATYSSGLLIRR